MQKKQNKNSYAGTCKNQVPECMRKNKTTRRKAKYKERVDPITNNPGSLP